MSARSATAAVVRPARRIRGRVRIPGDKSISHRYAMLAGLAEGRSRIEHYAPGADCAATLGCLAALGIEARLSGGDTERNGTTVEIAGRGLKGLRPPGHGLDARNSGTTMRLLAGILAAHPFEVTITGDESLNRRPMGRIIEPLERMGARLTALNGRPPLTIRGGALHGIEYVPAIPSAQVKSAVLLAGLQADGRTTVRETIATRNHTELALEAFGARVDRVDGGAAVEGGQSLTPGTFRVPGDLSSAAFLAVAAAALPGSDVELIDVGLNPTRTALLDVLRLAGAEVECLAERSEAGEPRGKVRIRHRELHDLTVRPADVPGLIDELPVLAALATHGGAITVTGAAELRAKESDRIAALVSGLKALGADAEELSDGFIVRGVERLRGGTADAAGDHRLAMAFAVAALGGLGPSAIDGADVVQVSYPGFFDVLESISE